jgi:hypothetical protein
MGKGSGKGFEAKPADALPLPFHTTFRGTGLIRFGAEREHPHDGADRRAMATLPALSKGVAVSC